MSELFQNMGLDPILISALEKEQITNPTDIQSKVVLEIKLNKDLIFQSPTASGKTLAYILPLFERLKESPKEMKTIILAPTHELVIQIHRQIERLSENSGLAIKSIPLIGGANVHRQIDKLKTRPQILVGSPGRILELIEKKKIKSQKIEVIILDEVDQLLDMNNSPSVLKIIKRIPRERQFIASSATLPGNIIKILGTLSLDFSLIKSEEGETIPDSISHSYILTEQRDKIQSLRKMIFSEKPVKALVFLNNVALIDNLISKLEFHGIKAQDLHGANQKLDRKKVMSDYKSGKLKILVASDIAARGLQMDGITHIFNMDIPEKSKDYLHRAGRTGRNGMAGSVISLATDREAVFLKKIERELKIKIEGK
jgi:superfamily II DNA/RNA helicase